MDSGGLSADTALTGYLGHAQARLEQLGRRGGGSPDLAGRTRQLMDGDATAVRASLVRLFGGHGFTVDPVAETPIILTSATYTIRVSMFPRDHSAQTDVAITLTSR